MRAAITDRLNSPIEIGRFEHESIESARERLATTLKAKPVEVVKLALVSQANPKILRELHHTQVPKCVRPT
jgi:hypothetical protein